METAIRENDFVLIICTPAYKARADGCLGGVGYEGDIITGQVLTDSSNRKVIPILRQGEWQMAAPSFCLGRYFIDLSSNPYSEERYQDLLSALLGNREQAPPLGPLPRSLLRKASLAEAEDNRALYPIEYGAFPVVKDSDSARGMLIATFRDALIETFGDHQARFAAALYVGTAGAEGAEFSVYHLWSHQKQFVFHATMRHEALIREVIKAGLSGGDRQRMREQFGRQFEEREKGHARWIVEADVAFDKFPRSHWITYEPSIKRLQIKADREQSADPKDYDEKVGTTSEALTYACALGGRPAAFLGDLAWQSDNFGLLKLTLFIIDRRVLDFTRFRVMGDDPETWDFRYPELEAEMKDRS
jgi:hypothetical protein